MFDAILTLMTASAALTLTLIGAHMAWGRRSSRREIAPWSTVARDVDGRLLEQRHKDGSPAFMVLTSRLGVTVELRSEEDSTASALVLVPATSHYLSITPRADTPRSLRGVFGRPTMAHDAVYDTRFVIESGDPDWARGVLSAPARALHLEHPDLRVELCRGCLRLTHPRPTPEQLEAMATLAAHFSKCLEGALEGKRAPLS
ncbi:MAG: hypothetical protein AAGI01_04870 [Myxococcota bacterium]